MSSHCAFATRLNDQYWAYQLLRRKLRTKLACRAIKTLRPKDLCNLYFSLHRESPVSGLVPSITSMPQARESFLYMALFASIYRSACPGDIRSEIDLNAMIFAWDTFCTIYPNHILERRPFGRIRPANFDEAWIITEAMKDGLAELPYCTSCHLPYLVIHGCKYQQVCQMCVLNQMRKSKYLIG
ncbi:FlhC family transcriptional regulator [Methylomonas sp. MO1]|uniref:FlhC family transcriptional regulator n=1 Tax=Methylomonas sp. MO1 TaxID=3073619 RepID=UPI000477F502|nr:FlhC family transcriptional regulator [Methylomonas sp. MO1]MDT4291673.1 FlhC family transcriptional regulator [Methylomonas sp. MO1]